MTSSPDPALPGAPRARERPFTRAAAAAAGTSRSRFERLLRDGVVERVLLGVYADALAPRSAPFRAEAVRLALRSEDAVATGRTAAWVHGVDVAAFARPGAPPVPTSRGRRVRPARDVVRLHGLALTTPLRTLLDLARHDEAEVALAAADQLLASGVVSRRALLAVLASTPDVAARAVLAQADGRARGAAESVLRLHWHASALPTPVPGLVVPGRRAAVRLALGVPDRRFGALLGSAHGGPDAAADDLARVREAGWWLVEVPDAVVLGRQPGQVRRHLEREFHQALLREVG